MAQETKGHNGRYTQPGGTRAHEQADATGGGAGTDSPGDLEKGDWKGVLKRTWREFREDNLTDWAAALTYYGVLSLFPGLLVLVSLLGFMGTSATQGLIDNLTTVAPGPARDIATNAIESLQGNAGAASLAALLGILVAIWAASNYVGAFSRATNAIYEVPEGRPFWKLKPLQIGLTLLMVVLLAACALAVVLTGPIAQAVGDVVGVGDTAVMIWNIAKWPVIALVFMTMLAILYYVAPNVEHPKFRWVSPGGVVGVIGWVIASGAFAFYVANFGNYEKTYGALGGVIIFLTWLWISNIVVLLGAELNAETERGREIKKGMRPKDKEPFLPLRDDSKLKKDEESKQEKS